jgi:hypothetical protein
MNTFDDGPYIYGYGDILKPDLVARSATSGEGLSSPFTFAADDSYYTTTPVIVDESSKDLPKEVLKASGVPRARNSSHSTVYAALLSRAFVDDIKQFPDFHPNKVAVEVVNSSSSATVSWEFENEGIQLGWGMTNTMLMPYALPSSVGTQVAGAAGLHGTTITFQNDIMGMCSAIEYTHLNFLHDRSNDAFVIGTEETSPAYKMIMDMIRDLAGVTDHPFVRTEGACGILFSKRKHRDDCWRLGLSHSRTHDAPLKLPDGWTDAPMMRFTLPKEQAVFSSLVLPFALQELLIARKPDKKALISVEMEDRGRHVLGFVRD